MHLKDFRKEMEYLQSLLFTTNDIIFTTHLLPHFSCKIPVFFQIYIFHRIFLSLFQNLTFICIIFHLFNQNLEFSASLIFTAYIHFFSVHNFNISNVQSLSFSPLVFLSLCFYFIPVTPSTVPLFMHIS